MNCPLKQRVLFCLSFFSAASIESLLFRTCTSGVRILRLSACEVICMTGQHRQQKLSKCAKMRQIGGVWNWERDRQHNGWLFLPAPEYSFQLTEGQGEFEKLQGFPCGEVMLHSRWGLIIKKTRGPLKLDVYLLYLLLAVHADYLCS
jgi:hypothetical protein